MSKRTLNNSVRKNCTDMILSDIDFEGMLNSARYTVTRYVTGTGSCDKFDFKVSKDNNISDVYDEVQSALLKISSSPSISDETDFDDEECNYSDELDISNSPCKYLVNLDIISS